MRQAAAAAAVVEAAAPGCTQTGMRLNLLAAPWRALRARAPRRASSPPTPLLVRLALPLPMHPCAPQHVYGCASNVKGKLAVNPCNAFQAVFLGTRAAPGTHRVAYTNALSRLGPVVEGTKAWLDVLAGERPGRWARGWGRVHACITLPAFLCMSLPNPELSDCRRAWPGRSLPS